MFRIYRGNWQIYAREQGQAEVALRIELDTGLPYLDHFVNPVLADAFQAMAQELLDGLESTAAKPFDSNAVSALVAFKEFA